MAHTDPTDPTDLACTDPTDPTSHLGRRDPAEGVGGLRAPGAGTPLAVGPPASPAVPFLRANENLNCNHNVQHAKSPPLPYDVATYPSLDPDYNWRLDAYHCYLLALRLKALAAGSIRPATPAELYWQEQHGQIP